MTTPDERLRALQWTGEFLQRLRLDRDTPEEIRKEAVHLLRHYPTEVDWTDFITMYLGLTPWILPERFSSLTGVPMAVIDAATEAQGSFAAAWVWLRNPCPELDGRRPLAMLLKNYEVEKVYRVLGLDPPS